ncbi:lipoprotein signal peptidase [Bacteroides sp. 519]|uniref:lipoprotein signal peptidase n=1 Tax=Bacteroides sp. 519 TaxID=2302937 RepID=UPI0013D4810F|nr:lipoprotein signal peptidase [Bacteroides sp. 519]NDV59756.1 lipoprotein signal peptidase [Bacteroides sp. 519]
MKISLSKGQLSIIIVLLVLIIDQWIKIWIKTNMYWHESIRITDWFFIYFTENNGMAFGMEIFGKLFLTLFRIVAVSVIGWYLAKIIKQKLKTGYVICVSLILAGAIGNIIDSIFYGVIFEASDPVIRNVANFVPIGEGYSSWFHGKVVDMFYFPIIQTTWPTWMPFGMGGQEFVFFSPIFNFADAAISCGMIALILFYGRYLNTIYHSDKTDKVEKSK